MSGGLRFGVGIDARPMKKQKNSGEDDALKPSFPLTFPSP